MKTKKLLAMIMSTALCISNSVPLGFSEMNTYAESPVTFADSGNKIGDVNSDDAVDANDASMVLEEYAMISTGKDSVLNDKQKKAADVDKNGDIDASDATIILSYYSYASTGGQLDVAQFIELMFITPPAESTTTTTASTTKPSTTTTVTTKSTAKTTTATSNSTAKTTTTTSNSTAKTTTATSNSTAKTTTATSNSTAKTTTATTNSTAKTTTATTNSTAKTTTTTTNSTAKATTTTTNSTAKTTTTTSNSTTKATTTTTTTTTATTIITTTTQPTTTVITNQNVSEIVLNRNEINIAVGQSERITDIKVIPENAINREMKWESSDNNVAIVNNLGWIIGKNVGQCKIVISSVENPNVFAIIIVNVYDGEPTTATTTAATTTTTTSTATTTTTTESATTTTVTTNIRVTGMSVSKNNITLSVGGKDIPLVTMYPGNAPDKNEIWISDNETVATVDKYGWITGVSVGECTITVYSVSNPAVFSEIKVKVVDEDVPAPEFNFSYILSEKSDSKNIAFYTPIPKNASGRFLIKYVITDSNGNVSLVTSTVLAPEMQGTVTMLTANTNQFTVEAFITNLETDSIAKIGSYEFTLNPRDARTVIEDIYYAFYVIKGLT